MLAAGSGELQLGDGTSTLTLEYRDGGVFQADWLDLVPRTAVHVSAWSAVKQLFR